MKRDFFEQLVEIVDRFPDQVALQSISESGRESFSYRQIGEEVGKIGLFLQHSGVRPGERVGILMENHPRWGIGFLAAQSAGAVIVPLDNLHQAETLAALIRHAECKFLMVSQKLLPLFEQIQGLLPATVPALISGGELEGHACWEAILRETDASASLPLVQRGPDQELLILYTSGTTGTPKGVLLTQRNVFRNVAEILEVIHASSDDHILSVLPLYHALALMTNFLIPLHMGGRVTYLQVLDAQRVLATFREEGITIFVCVPQFYYLLYRRIHQEVERQGFVKRLLFHRLLSLSRVANRRLGWNPGRFMFRSIHKKFGSSLRLLGVGGARFDRRIAESFRDLGFNLVQAYGLTETAALVTVAPATAGAVGSVGRPLPHTQVRIDQPDDAGIGEVLIRGENVMQGYWRNPEATAEVMAGGWLRSGDLGYVDSRGCLHITGRKKDVIVLSSGKNIFPEEVEHFYQSNCPLIKEMCVLGVPDTDSSEQEEQLYAIIVPDFEYLKRRQVVNAYDAIRWELETLSPQLPPYKRVRSFEIRSESLPRTTTLKLKRFEVQKEVAGGGRRKDQAPRVVEWQPETAAEHRIVELIRQIKNPPAIDKTMNLELDLGFSSLERVELLSGVQEAFGIQMSDEEAAMIFTVHDLIDAFEKKLVGDLRELAQDRASWSEILRRPLEAEEQRKVRELLAERPVVDVTYLVFARFLRLLFWPLFRLKFRGLRNLPEEYPFVICPNHVTYLDMFFILSGLPYRVLRRLFILGDADYFDHPIMSRIGRLGKVIPVNPDRGPRLSLRLAAEGLRGGLVLCVFPEGERSIDGSVKSFRMGPAIVASELGAPVVPAGISGAGEVWPRGSNKIRLRPVSVSFGNSLVPYPGAQSYGDFNNRLYEAVRELVECEKNSPCAPSKETGGAQRWAKKRDRI